jgi:hypothetical protein
MIKKIISKEEQEEKRSRNLRVITIILGAIMILSTLSYAFMSFQDNSGSSVKNSKITYKGLVFQKTSSGTWSFILLSKTFETLFNPLEIKNNVSINLKKTIYDFQNKPLYIGINSLDDVASNGNYEIVKNLQGIITKSQFSCLDNSCTEDYPIKNCSKDNILIFKKSLTNSSSIQENSNCTILTYSQGSEEIVSDAFLFKIFGL